MLPMYPNRASNPRKRAAPGASPLVPAQQPFPVASDSVVRWAQGADSSPLVDGAARSMNLYNAVGTSQGQFGQASLSASPSNAVARRPSNALVPAGLRPHYDWSVGYDDANFLTHTSTEDMDENDNLEVLLEKAQRAKRDAATKRKQIPPFVQKLSRYETWLFSLFLGYTRQFVCMQAGSLVLCTLISLSSSNLAADRYSWWLTVKLSPAMRACDAIVS